MAQFQYKWMHTNARVTFVEWMHVARQCKRNWTKIKLISIGRPANTFLFEFWWWKIANVAESFAIIFTFSDFWSHIDYFCRLHLTSGEHMSHMHTHTHKHQMTTAQLHLWSNRWMNIYEKQMKTAYACTFCDPKQFTAFNWVQHNRLFQSMEKKSATMRWHRRNEFLQLWFNLVNENNRNQRMNTRLELLGSEQICMQKKNAVRSACVSRNYSHSWIVLLFFWNVNFRCVDNSNVI